MKKLFFILFISVTFIYNYHASCYTNSDLLNNEDEEMVSNSSENFPVETSEKFFYRNPTHEIPIRIDTFNYPEINLIILKSFISSETKDYVKTFNEQLEFIYNSIEGYRWWRYREGGIDIYSKPCKNCFDKVKADITYLSDSRMSLNVFEIHSKDRFGILTFLNYIISNETLIPVNFSNLFIIDIDSLHYCGYTGELHYGDLYEKFEDPHAYCRWLGFGSHAKRNGSFTFVDDGIAILYPTQPYLFWGIEMHEYDGRIIKFKEMEPYLNRIFIK